MKYIFCRKLISECESNFNHWKTFSVQNSFLWVWEYCQLDLPDLQVWPLFYKKRVSTTGKISEILLNLACSTCRNRFLVQNLTLTTGLVKIYLASLLSTIKKIFCWKFISKMIRLLINIEKHFLLKLPISECESTFIHWKTFCFETTYLRVREWG